MDAVVVLVHAWDGSERPGSLPEPVLEFDDGLPRSGTLMAAPPSVVCPLCGTQDDLETPTPLPDGAWQFVCRGFHQPSPYGFETSADQKLAPHPEGLAAELGLWEDLPKLLSVGEPWVEYGIVEYRYALAHPVEYGMLVEKYGHTAGGPKKFTASAFIARTLGHLAADDIVAASFHPGTGYWKHNNPISFWVDPASFLTSDSDVITWQQFAEKEGFDPLDWPPLGYRHPTS